MSSCLASLSSYLPRTLFETLSFQPPVLASSFPNARDLTLCLSRVAPISSLTSLPWPRPLLFLFLLGPLPPSAFPLVFPSPIRTSIYFPVSFLVSSLPPFSFSLSSLPPFCSLGSEHLLAIGQGASLSVREIRPLSSHRLCGERRYIVTIQGRAKEGFGGTQESRKQKGFRREAFVEEDRHLLKE